MKKVKEILCYFIEFIRENLYVIFSVILLIPAVLLGLLETILVSIPYDLISGKCYYNLLYNHIKRDKIKYFPFFGDEDDFSTFSCFFLGCVIPCLIGNEYVIYKN